MKRAFLHQDNKLQKFWTIDYDGLDFCVNYGKYGAIGKFAVKEFASEEECVREAEKLIRQKLKKGYREEQGFDFENRIYIDDEEIGPHPKTSHPRFTAHFTAEFYYDCCEEEAPFGSDEGADTLAELGAALRKNSSLDFSAFPEKLVENMWGMAYLPAGPEDSNAPAGEERELLQSDIVTFATALGQIKLTGRVDEELRQRALWALRRFETLMSGGKDGFSAQMIEALRSFQNPPAEGAV